MEQENQVTKPSTLLLILSFIIPLVGIILYFVKKGEEPIPAKAYLKYALIGIIVGVALNFIF